MSDRNYDDDGAWGDGDWEDDDDADDGLDAPRGDRKSARRHSDGSDGELKRHRPPQPGGADDATVGDDDLAWFDDEAARADGVATPDMPTFLGVRHVEQTVAPKIVLQIGLWNIANLGGGFGWPTRRANEVMRATTSIIDQMRLDICVVLELKTRPPKPKRVVAYDPAEARIIRGCPLDQAELANLLKDLNESPLRHEIDAAIQAIDPTLPHFWFPMKTMQERAVSAHLLRLQTALYEEMQRRAAAKPAPMTVAPANTTIWERLRSYSADADTRNPEAEARRQAAFEADLAAWNANATEGACAGFREFERIGQGLAAIVAREGWAYRYWPSSEAEARSLQKDGEACGFIYNDWYWELIGVRSIDRDQFSKRAPVMATFRHRQYTTEVDVVAYHAPSDSAKNSAARAHDLPQLMASCDTLRASGRIVVLASDLNIDTSEASSPYVPSCDAAINTVTFFDQLSSEPGFLSRSLLRTRKTTLRLTRLDEVVEDDDAGDAVAASSADAAVGSADADPEVAAMEAGIAAAAARSAALDRGAQGFEIYANAFDKIVLLTPQPQGITGILRRREESIPTPHTMASATQIQLLPRNPWYSSLMTGADRDAWEHLVRTRAAQMQSTDDLRSLQALLVVTRQISDHLPISVTYWIH